MADDTRRSVTLQRTSLGRYEVRNARGGTLTIGVGEGADFTPVELLLAALGGCTGADIDYITRKREVLPRAARMSHDRLCTVSRTVELGTPVDTRIAP